MLRDEHVREYSKCQANVYGQKVFWLQRKLVMHSASGGSESGEEAWVLIDQ